MSKFPEVLFKRRGLQCLSACVVLMTLVVVPMLCTSVADKRLEKSSLVVHRSFLGAAEAHVNRFELSMFESEGHQQSSICMPPVLTFRLVLRSSSSLLPTRSIAASHRPVIQRCRRTLTTHTPDDTMPKDKGEKTSYQLKVPKGTKDWEGRDMVIRDKIFTNITNVFKRHGAVTIDTLVKILLHHSLPNPVD